MITNIFFDLKFLFNLNNMSRGKGLPQNLPTLEVSHHPLLETSMRPSLGFFLKLCKSTESKKKYRSTF